ncbi:MAG: hypothetical protein J6D47_17915 [Peptostreptococcaceae bacterium]|nr:hypothetical protein [Peptostreptococcaceae bacterium]
MELIKASDCKTLEEYRAYQRQKSKIWYQNNREKKIQYQKDRYYNSKKINQDKQD